MNNGHQVLTCGACSVFVDASGEMTTSIDRLASGIKRLINREPVRSSQRSRR